jgi:methylenetetrahydrofolate dehydrogenase (NADP+)/methenyltetrahydrofolate cyclohydrolase
LRGESALNTLSPVRGNIIDGAAIAAHVQSEVRDEVEKLEARGVTPGLSVVLVGDDAASAVYVRSKEITSRELGMAGETILLPSTTTQSDLLGIINRLNASDAVHGILVQMPLPQQIDADAILRRIRPEKDVDGFHPVNVGKLLIGETDGFVPCTPAGIQYMLAACEVETRGAECVVVGRSNIVGKPMAALMMQNGPFADATVTVCHSRTRELAMHTRRADILIVAAGRPLMITADMVRRGAVVIDVGMNRIPDATKKSGTRLVGDVDFDRVQEIASLITPVPGGVGKMTIAMLMRNTVRAAARAAR